MKVREEAGQISGRPRGVWGGEGGRGAASLLRILVSMNRVCDRESDTMGASQGQWHSWAGRMPSITNLLIYCFV